MNDEDEVIDTNTDDLMKARGRRDNKPVKYPACYELQHDGNSNASSSPDKTEYITRGYQALPQR